MGFELTPKQIDTLFEKASVALQKLAFAEAMAAFAEETGAKGFTVCAKDYAAASEVYLEILDLLELTESFARYLEKK